MYLNQFSVRVVGGNEVSGGYVELSHDQQYQLSLRNDRNVRCDARVEVDGKHVGTWRIEAHNNIVLERPAHDTGNFTFYKLGTQESQQAALNGNDPNLGLVKVTFTPEVEPRPLTGTYTCNTSFKGMTLDSMPCASAGAFRSTMSAGGTGLSGESSQQFYQASRITYDSSQQTVIHLRLVCKESNVGSVIRPLTAFSTPVPPRV